MLRNRTRFAPFGVLVPLALALLVFSCGDDSTPGAFHCTSDTACDDHIECTVDSCGISGACMHTSVNERCPTGQMCVVGDGCRGACTSDPDCDDRIPCTLDSCGVGGVCRATPVNERCTGGMTCSATTGCTSGADGGMSTSCMSSSECNDDVPCTVDSCGVDRSCTHMALNELCPTGQTCHPGSGCAMARTCDGTLPEMVRDEQCQDGNLCNGRERCDPEVGCVPPVAPNDCEDGDPCTINQHCDTTLDMCVYDCNHAMASCSTHPICAAPPVEMFPATVDIVPSIMDACNGLAPEASFSITTFELTTMGPILTVRAMPRERGGCTMTQAPVPTDGRIDATCMVSGECVETLRLTGMFTDRTHFTGTFSAVYVTTPGSTVGCGEELFGSKICADETISVTGTRRGM